MTDPDNKIARIEWLFPGIVTASCVLAAVLYVLFPSDQKMTGANSIADARKLFNVCLLFALAASGVWFAYAFTGDPFQRRSEMVRFAYFFVLASLAVLSIPPLVKSQAIGTEPIGIVSGCVPHTKADQINCTFTDEEERNAGRSDGGKEMPSAAAAPAGTAAPAGGDKGKAGKTAVGAAGNKTGAAATDNKTGAAATDNKTGAAPEAKPVSNADTTTGADRYRNQWLVNIGGTLRSQDSSICKDKDGKPSKEPECKPGSASNRVFITGGIVVPFPFVIIAMFGGAISLSRRVPEIQKRSEVGYAGTAAEPALQSSEVRELLAFQILQFISAPLIAITAHQVIQPESQTTSVALAFMAGFGSESILVMIRGAFNGIQPKSVTPAAATVGSVGGVVTDAGQPIDNIEVGIAGSALKAKTDSNGNYLIHDVPVGGRDVVAVEPHRSAKATVAIVSGHAAVCDLALIRTGAVQGVVRDAQDKPFAGAKVHVNKLLGIKTVSGKDGTYTLDAVPVGDQQIKAEAGAGAKKTGGEAQTAVQYGETATCDIKLK